MAADALPWAREAGESSKWFARFEMFRKLGPNRTLLAAYVGQLDPARPSTSRPQAVPSTWSAAAQRHRWRERADLYDRAEAEAAAAKHQVEMRKLVHEHQQRCIAIAKLKLGTVNDMAPAVKLATAAQLKAAADWTPTEFASILRALAHFAETGLMADAEAIGVKDLMEGQLAARDANPAA